MLHVFLSKFMSRNLEQGISSYILFLFFLRCKLSKRHGRVEWGIDGPGRVEWGIDGPGRVRRA